MRWRNQVWLLMAIPAVCVIAEVQVVVYLPRMFLGLVFPVFNVLWRVMLLNEAPGRAAPIFSEFDC